MKKRELLILTFALAFTAEIIPIIGQLAFLGIHNFVDPINIRLDDNFIVSRGFYIFQIAGFYLSFIFFYVLMVKDKGKHLVGGILFFLFSVVLEISFYWIAPVTFRFVYIYSFLDKFVAISMAFFTYLIYKDSFYSMISMKK